MADEQTSLLIEQREAMKSLWIALAISEEPPRPLQFVVWLCDYGCESLAAALQVTCRWLNRQPDPVSVSMERLIKYTSKVMSNAKADGMTEGEREKEISEMRSLLGKVGARIRWQNAKKQISHDLLSVSHALPSFVTRGSGSVSVSGSHSDSVSDSAAKSSENEQPQKQQQDRTDGTAFDSTPTPKPAKRLRTV